jgi:hypothetical protein
MTAYAKLVMVMGVKEANFTRSENVLVRNTMFPY